MSEQQRKWCIMDALGEQNRRDFYDAHCRTGTVQELMEFYWHYNGGKEMYGEV